MRKILVIGATSAIAEATARLFAEAGDALFLVARNKNKLCVVADDLKVRGAPIICKEALDVLDYERHKVVIDAAIDTLEGLDVALIAHGTLSDQNSCEQSFDSGRKEFEVNALSTISLLTCLANYFEKRKRGTIAVVSSVAGDRGRQSNYYYGSAKGAVTIFLQGLRDRLSKAGVNVITIKPGFVDTPMTIEFRKNPLWSTPDRIAKIIYSAVTKSKGVVYAPFYWRHIMLGVKLLPDALFRRMPW